MEGHADKIDLESDYHFFLNELRVRLNKTNRIV